LSHLACRIGHLGCKARTSETNRVQSVLFGMQNRMFVPYLSTLARGVARRTTRGSPSPWAAARSGRATRPTTTTASSSSAGARSAKPRAAGPPRRPPAPAGPRGRRQPRSVGGTARPRRRRTSRRAITPHRAQREKVTAPHRKLVVLLDNRCLPWACDRGVWVGRGGCYCIAWHCKKLHGAVMLHAWTTCAYIIERERATATTSEMRILSMAAE
jgi:hypothetical protein